MGRRMRRQWCQLATINYTGDGAATQAIVGVGFQPRVVWIHLWGSVTMGRGVATDVEMAGFTKIVNQAAGLCGYYPDLIISLNPDGFTVGDGTGLSNIFNALGVTYVAVCWG